MSSAPVWVLTGIVVLLGVCAPKPAAVAPVGACAPDRERTQVFAERVRAILRDAPDPLADSVRAVYDPALCARAAAAWRREDQPAVRDDPASQVYLVAAGQNRWFVFLAAEPNVWHILDGRFHHVGDHAVDLD